MPDSSGAARAAKAGRPASRPDSHLASLRDCLAQGRFAITAEVAPPLSADPPGVRDLAAPLLGLVNAVNVTDGAGARTAMSSLAAAAILQEAGFEMSDIVRVQYFITDPSDAGRVFPIVGEIFADIRPAATMLVTGLIRPEMRIEIEATALKAHP